MLLSICSIYDQFWLDTDTEFPMSHSGADPSNVDRKVIMNPSDETPVDPQDWRESAEIFINSKDDLELTKSHGESDADSITSPDETGTGNLCDQERLSNALSIGLQKSVVLESADGLSADLVDDGTLHSEDRQSALSDERFITTKFVHLKIRLDGKQLDSSNASQILIPADKNPVHEEPESNTNRGPLRKTSSLKAAKTPPGTPSAKKMVRFADALGLDLASVRTVLDTDNPPRIPDSAISGLEIDKDEIPQDVCKRYLGLCFEQPGAKFNFIDRVLEEKVALENCLIKEMSIQGMVRVANIGFHKCVRIRYSHNNWVTFYDIMASYVPNSCDVKTDRYSFVIVAPCTLGPGAKISFAISYSVSDSIYWDNNHGKNYEVLCSVQTASTDVDYV